ncbi:MAG: polysaccharide biosynthesis/export family protein [Flavobacteriales bacterium]|nr:polysaccharide biosynthesis/export family protein [Flavobacteriales bacterium]
MRLKIFLVVLVIASFSSCDRYLYQNRMIDIPSDYEYSKFENVVETEYRLAPDDYLNVRLLTNDGAGLLNISVDQGVSVGGATLIDLRIESDGFAKFPIFGRLYLEGLTLRQAEMLIEDKYAEFYNSPFVLLTVTNRRVMIFAGDNTQVVQLTNDNMTLFEVLAISGGIPEDGKSRKIKIIRGDLQNPDVYLIDLSTLQGMRDANLVMQANDIIYIEVRKRYATKLLQELTPIISILGTVISTIALITAVRSLGGK